VLEYGVGSAAISKGWAYYVVSFLDSCGAQLPDWLMNGAPLGNPKYGNANLLAALLVLAITVLLVIGIKESARVSNVIVCTKLVTLVIVIFAGIQFVNPANFQPFIPPEFGVSGMFAGASIVFFAYIGFDSVSVVAEEAQKPSRDIPLGIMLSLGICTALYVGVVLVMVGMVPYTEMDTHAPLVSVFKAHGMRWAEILVSIGAITGLTSTTLSTMMPQSRIFLAMARDGLLFPVFGKISKRFGTPIYGTLITGFCCALLAGLVEMDVLSDAVSIGTLFAFSIVCSGVLILRYQKPGQEHVSKLCLGLYFSLLVLSATAPNNSCPIVLRISASILSGISALVTLYKICRMDQVPVEAKFICPLVPAVPVMGMLGNLYLMCHVGAEAWLRLVIWLALGLLIYFFYSIRHSRLNSHSHPLVHTSPPGHINPEAQRPEIHRHAMYEKLDESTLLQSEAEMIPHKSKPLPPIPLEELHLRVATPSRPPSPY